MILSFYNMFSLENTSGMVRVLCGTRSDLRRSRSEACARPVASLLICQVWNGSTTSRDFSCLILAFGMSRH